MADRPIITPELCQKWLKYDPESGKLFWKQRSADDFRKLQYRSQEWMRDNWNSGHAGKEAFTSIAKRGNKFGTINRRVQSAHRVIWAIVHGVWPFMIDHISGDPGDNRLVNLRDVGPIDNARNSAIPNTNVSGHIGIRWFARLGRWHARIMVSKRDIHLGYFYALEDAIAARKAAEIKYRFHANHGRHALRPRISQTVTAGS